MKSLAGVSLPDLQRLLASIQTGQVACPLGELDLRSLGLGHVERPLLAVLGGLDAAAVTTVVEVAVGERTHRPVPRVDLVWTGPEGQQGYARDTAVVVRQLFESATRSVLIAGYRFDHVGDLLEPLHRAMRERQVAVRLVMNIERRTGDPTDPDECARLVVDHFFQLHWKWAEPRPDIYYDPDTARTGPKWEGVSMHAKCIVVDEQRTLIGSANFTERAQERNIEAGVLVEDSRLADLLVRQWNGLVAAGHLRRAR